MIEYSANLSCLRHFVILGLFSFYQPTAPMGLLIQFRQRVKSTITNAEATEVQPSHIAASQNRAVIFFGAPPERSRSIWFS